MECAKRVWRGGPKTPNMLTEDMKTMARFWMLAPLCGTLGLVAACTAGQTGGEIGAGEPNGTGGTEGTGGGPTTGGGLCEVTDTTLVPAHEVTPLGYSADQILAFAGGAHRVPVQWKDGSSEFATLSTTPTSGATELELTVSYEDGEVSLVQRRAGTSDGAGPAIASDPCNDQLTIEVAVQVKTDNGAFDDTFPATLTVDTASHASLHIDFDPEDLGGTFRTDVLTPADAVAKQFALDAAFAPGGFAGGITGMITGGNEQVAYAGGAEFARWPEGHCSEIRGIPMAVTDEGLGQAAWDALAYEAPLAFRWEDGTETALTLELSSPDGEGCYQYEGFSGLEYVSFDVQAHAQTADERIDGTWSLAASIELTNGVPSRTTLYQRGNFGAVPVASFESATGISGADLTGQEQAGFDLQLESDLSAEPSTRSGTFAIVGVTPASCPTVAVPDGSESPGCAGTETTELETATISD